MSDATDKAETIAPAGRVRPASGGATPRKAGRGIRHSFMGLVLLPSLIFGGYNMLAADRFVAGSSFVVRSMQSGQGGGDLLESITGSVSAGSTKSDSHIVRRYLESADLVREIDSEFGLQDIYGGARGDIVQRLSADANFEDKLTYWQRRVHSTYDHTTGILTLEVQAFSAEDAERIATAVMDKVRRLVNDLSHSARESSLAYARAELAVAETALVNAQEGLKSFRADNGFADPTTSAGRDDQLLAELNRQIVTERANLEVLSMNVSAPGPNITRLEQRIAALEGQREQLMGERGGGGEASVVSADAIGDYEALTMGVEIARSRYVATLEGMEAARRDAERQQRYLAIFDHPYAADEARYPRRIIDSLLAMLGLLVAWSIGCFLVQMVRDHRK